MKNMPTAILPKAFAAASVKKRPARGCMKKPATAINLHDIMQLAHFQRPILDGVGYTDLLRLYGASYGILDALYTSGHAVDMFDTYHPYG